MIFEWQKSDWEQFLRLAQKIPHALLLHGPKGIGKFEFAKAAADLLLCRRAGTGLSQACGRCSACLLQAQGNHPDFFLIQPEADAAETGDGEAEQSVADKKKKPSKQIKISQIRDLLDTIQAGTHQGGRRVILLAPAEAMNPATANALLKTLEEPPPDTVMLLVSNEPDRLLPTIRSRCQGMAFGEPDPGLALDWLKTGEVADAANLLARHGGAPLLAKEAATAESGLDFDALIAGLARPQDPLACADAMSGAEPVAVVDGLQRWVSDLATFALAGSVRYFPGHAAAIGAVAKSASPLALLRFARRLTELRAIAQFPVNPRLFAERLALDYADAVGASPRLGAAE
jgi:DNA polymerase III subunit delta'